ncbi:hypothetical protein X772_34705 [Mesorhizobium sp. LSJC280B00]|nr:hypothetical protein X772_34705 [Mesorhizobium sp. LSJC280B00]
MILPRYAANVFGLNGCRCLSRNLRHETSRELA